MPSLKKPGHHLLVVTGVCALVMLLPTRSVASESGATNAPALKSSEATPGPRPTTYEGPGPQPKVGSSEKTATGETWGERSYVIPLVEVVTFAALLNLYDRNYTEPRDIYRTSGNTFEHNVQTVPKVDSDLFQINQLYHPYQGAMYFGFARSAGLSYWQSLLYSLGGSELWETAGETDPPSFNDHVASGLGGSFLGEPLFRMASLVLEGGGKQPGFLRELAATCVSPPTGINRLAFGDRFDAVFPSHNPPTFTRLRLGLSTQAREADNGPLKTYDRQQASVDFALAYGLPGKASYTYDRPFDYFNFEAAAGSGKDTFQNIMCRGLLLGTDYDVGDSYRGLWGLYGSYDYLSPHTFRVSSTALSLGTTAQWLLLPGVALQYTALGGIGYAAAGTISGPGERNYRYGTTPQGLLAAHLVIADRVLLDMTAREYYVTDWTGAVVDGHEQISRVNAGLTVRVYGQHALGIQFVATTRDASAVGAADRQQKEQIISVVYNLLGDDGFGVVGW